MRGIPALRQQQFIHLAHTYGKPHPPGTTVPVTIISPFFSSRNEDELDKIEVTWS